MTDRELMQQALEALEMLARYENPATRVQVRKPRDGGPIVTMYPHKVATDAAAPLRERLAITSGSATHSADSADGFCNEPVVLDDKTLWEMWVESPSDVLRFARAIEQAHGIKGQA